jgi:hypothetical protein
MVLLYRAAAARPTPDGDERFERPLRKAASKGRIDDALLIE